jgi:hypothetical protein
MSDPSAAYGSIRAFIEATAGYPVKRVHPPWATDYYAALFREHRKRAERRRRYWRHLRRRKHGWR